MALNCSASQPVAKTHHYGEPVPPTVQPTGTPLDYVPPLATISPGNLLGKSPEEVAKYAVETLQRSGEVKSGTPEVLLARAVSGHDLQTLGLGCGYSSAIEQAPWVLVVLKGDFELHLPGTFAGNQNSHYVALVYDMWAGLPTSIASSLDATFLSKVLNDPALPTQEPYVCPTQEPYIKTLHYGNEAPGFPVPPPPPSLPTATMGTPPPPPPISTFDILLGAGATPSVSPDVPRSGQPTYPLPQPPPTRGIPVDTPTSRPYVPQPTPRAEDPWGLTIFADGFSPGPKQSAEQADVVVLGTVKKVGPARWDTPDGTRPANPWAQNNKYSIFTPVVLSVEQYLKGTQPGGEVTIYAVGGSVGLDHVEYASNDLYKVQEGDRVIVCLSRSQEWVCRSSRWITGCCGRCSTVTP